MSAEDLVQGAAMNSSIDWQAANKEYLMEHAARGDADAAEILWGLALSERAMDTQCALLPTGRHRVAVGVCTAQRPVLLTRCLESVTRQLLPSGIELHVVVADNEAEPNNRRVVKALSARSPVPVHYVHEPRRGIPQARNAVLEKCQQLGVEWIGFTDDDCWASPTWVANHLAAVQRHQADVVYGRRKLVFPLPQPYWTSLLEPDGQTEGEGLDYASTHNVLFSATLLGGQSQPQMRFDERLTHGEDTDFFYRAARRGARIVYSAEPLVLEIVLPDRATLRYQTCRAYYSAASRSHFHRRHNGIVKSSVNFAARCLIQAPVALTPPRRGTSGVAIQ
jgi:succinoglycan biosynthesis protein ExoM